MKKLPILTGCLLALPALAHAAQPNILFIMSDDHTSQAVGVYNSRLAKLNPTPTIDSIAREGMVMENAFCQNAICTPSRANIMTGQSSAVNGCITLNEALPAKRQYLAIEMKKAGYQTAVIGKWHLHRSPAAFDYFKVLPGQGKYFDPIFYETGATGVTKWKNATFKNSVQMKGHSTDCITDSALDWLKTGREPEKPFFMKLHYKAPHDMFEYAPRYASYLADVTIPEPDNMRDRKNHGSIATRGHNDELVPYIGTSIGRRNPRRNYTKNGQWVKNLDQTKSDEEIIGDAYQYYMKDYLRCVKGVDDNLKRVVDYLKEEGLYDNTVIIYTGDQGFWLGEHDYMDKRWGYDESMRMPFIVRYPKTIKKGRSDAIVENIDYAPTMLDFAGVPTPDYMHGRSFKTILETGKEAPDWKTSAYYHYWMHMAHHDNPGHIAIRTKRYKLMMFYGTDWKKGQDTPDTPPGWELYDLKNDPGEDNNVYDDPKYADAIAALKKQLKARRSELGEDNPKFAFNKVIDHFWDYDAENRAEAIEISHAMRKKKEARYEATKKSLSQYDVPEWYQDAKLGIWPIWGPYSVPAYCGNGMPAWYGKWMYGVEKEPETIKLSSKKRWNDYYDLLALKTMTHHNAKYGGAANFGYHDFATMWKAEEWSPENWAQIAVDAGAKFFCMMGTFHDGFSLYDSDLTEWDSVDKGPKRDLCADMKKAAHARGLKFGISNHFAWNHEFYKYYHTNGFSKGQEKHADLYARGAGVIDEAYLKRWWDRTLEMVDKCQPDLYYFDWGWHAQPWVDGQYHEEFAQYFYNRAIDWGRGSYGKPGVVLNSKFSPMAGYCVRDLERGKMSRLQSRIWQTDTSISPTCWSYATDNEELFSADHLIDMLVDIVSKNGVLMLAFGPRADGTVPEAHLERLMELGHWLKVNGQAIYSTRPWTIAAEGPTVGTSEDAGSQYCGKDIRYTQSKNGKTLYATVLGFPEPKLTLLSTRVTGQSKKAKVTMLGNNRNIAFTVNENRQLVLDLSDITPKNAGCSFAYAMRIEGFEIEGKKPTVLESSDSKSKQIMLTPVRNAVEWKKI